jgi:hypothetical protein
MIVHDEDAHSHSRDGRTSAIPSVPHLGKIMSFHDAQSCSCQHHNFDDYARSTIMSLAIGSEFVTCSNTKVAHGEV